MIQIPLAIDRAAQAHIQAQLDDGLRQLIVNGSLLPNTRLPATRDLSKQLKISRNTARNSYENLTSQGYLCSKGTKGTYVSDSLPDGVIGITAGNPMAGQAISGNRDWKPSHWSPAFSTTARTFDFRLDHPQTFNVPMRIWRQLVLKHLSFTTRHPAPYDLSGALRLREAISSVAGLTRATRIPVENTFIVSSSQRALDIVAHLIHQNRNLPIALEDPCDKRASFILERFGNRIVRVPVDDEGLVVENLPTNGLAAVCVTPSYQYPMGSTMSLRRREALLSWAKRSGTYIIECDQEGRFCYEGSPLPTLYSMDSGQRVIYITSFSDWLGSGGANLAYFVVPADLAAGVASSWHFLNCPLPWLDLMVIADFITSQAFLTHLRKVWSSNKRKRDILVESITAKFGQQKLSGGHAGRHLVWHLPEEFPTAEVLRRRSEARGVHFSTIASDFAVSRQTALSDRIVLLAFSSIAGEHIPDGISRLLETVQGELIETRAN